MNKTEKIIITVVLVIIVIIILVATFGKGNSKNVNTNDTDLNNVSNNAIENIIEEPENETVENSITNEIVEDVEEEPIIENVTELKPQGTVYESGANHGTTDKKQQAINLVKEKWGDDNTVTYRCDSVTSDGEYIIAVVSTQSASVKNYFRVNLAHETVTIEY